MEEARGPAAALAREIVGFAVTPAVAAGGRLEATPTGGLEKGVDCC